MNEPDDDQNHFPHRFGPPAEALATLRALTAEHSQKALERARRARRRHRWGCAIALLLAFGCCLIAAALREPARVHPWLDLARIAAASCAGANILLAWQEWRAAGAVIRMALAIRDSLLSSADEAGKFLNE